MPRKPFCNLGQRRKRQILRGMTNHADIEDERPQNIQTVHEISRQCISSLPSSSPCQLYIYFLFSLKQRVLCVNYIIISFTKCSIIKFD